MYAQIHVNHHAEQAYIPHATVVKYEVMAKKEEGEGVRKRGMGRWWVAATSTRIHTHKERDIPQHIETLHLAYAKKRSPHDYTHTHIHTNAREEKETRVST